MRVLLALVLLVWGTSDAHYSSKHSLKELIFLSEKTSQYDITLNMTAGIPGMTSQLAKSSLQGVVTITPKSKSEFLLKVDNVRISRSEPGISSDEEDLTYRKDATLEAELKKSIKFTLENGKVTEYTLGKEETPESRNIKRSILRHFQGKFQSNDEDQEYPYTYSMIWQTPSGPAKVWYVVTVSPYPEFPNEQDVFNVSATSMYEYPRYTLVHEHHNFEKQGCPEICKPEISESTDEFENKCGAGCPVGYEPHHTPSRTYLNGQYNFRMENEDMILENLSMEEKYIASMYDQDMVVTISAEYEHKAFPSTPVEEPKNQKTYNNLEEDILPNVNRRQDVSRESAIFAALYELQAPKAVERCSTLLNKITETVVENKLESSRTQEVGEDLILLQKLLSFLKPEHLQKVWSKIVDKRSYKSADEKETVKRQILVDVLPLVGTSDCLDFIKSLIREDKLTTWEAKEVLEAVPQNLWQPSKKDIQAFEEIRKLPQIERHQLLLSAAYLAEARTFHIACARAEVNQSYQHSESSSDHSYSRYQRASRRDDDEDEDKDDEPEDKFYHSPRLTSNDSDSLFDYQCPKQYLRRFIEEVSQKLRSTRKMGEKAIYIQALAYTGSRMVLEHLAPYINASAPETESWAPYDIDSIQAECIYALHSLVSAHPNEVREYVSPIYFNRTETPRVRIAAFSVLLRSQPPVAVLHHIARDSWQETSNEVGSYVYSAMISYGNSSQPCMQHLKKRIQLIISQFKNYDIGIQYAQRGYQSYFDDVRNFGIESSWEYVPSNETALPSALYSELSYNLDSLKDTFYHLALNMHQGPPTDEIFDFVSEVVSKYIKIKSIPREKENKIFGTANLITRMPKAMRLFFYQKIFYSPSYMYIDAKSFQHVLEPLVEHVENIFPSSGSVRKGHAVKVYIPSSLHSLSIGYIVAAPVELDVKHPILLSLKAEIEVRKSQPEVRVKVTPSVFITEHHANQIWCPVTKTAYGVYHEQKFSWTMPFEVTCRLHQYNQTVSCDVKWPEMNKRVVRYHSEAGTYASPITMDRLPSTMNRQPIETIPVMFRKEQVLGLPTLPQLYVTAQTEDMSYGYDDIPRTWEECVDLAIQHLRNPGWRRKSINATIVPSPEGRSQVHSARIQISYNMTHESQNIHSRNEELNHPMPRGVYEKHRHQRSEYDDSSSRSGGSFGLQKSDAERIYHEMKDYSYIAHELSVEAYSWPNNGYAELRMELNHTYDKTKYTFMAEGTAQERSRRSAYKACMAHVTKYGYIPSELKYKSNAYDKQQVDFYNEMSFSSDCEVFKNPQFVSQGSFTHKPHRDILREEDDFDRSLDERWLLPETHEQCIEDMQNGKDLSMDCIKAIREETVYNNYRIRSEWFSEIPETLRNITEKVNQAIKYAFYPYADIDSLAQNKKSVVEINANYVTEFTDNPVFNVWVQTPRETVHYQKIDASYLTLPSSVYDYDQVILSQYTNNTYPPFCAIMKEHVNTYDNKIFKLPEDSCTYLLSAHCTSKKLFAVLGKNLKGSGTELTVYIGEHEIVLHPSRGSAYPIEFNGQKYNVQIKSPVVLDEEAGIYAHVVPAGNTRYNLVLHYYLGLEIVYDGENTKIEVHPFYKGQLCGLCSEYDGEVTREYIGIDQCLYMHYQDFAHSAVTDSRTCGVPTSPKYPMMCPYSSEPDSRSGPRDDDDDDDNNDYDDSDNSVNRESQRPRLQTVHMQKQQMVCFSTQPVYMCADGVEPDDTESQVVDFHCLPKHDATTRKLVKESENRILRELATKRVDLSERISTAKSCSH